MTAKIKLNAASGGGSVSLEAPTSTTGNANVSFKLPVADGTSGQALTTNASGQLAFSTISGGVSNITPNSNGIEISTGNSNAKFDFSNNSANPRLDFKANNVASAGQIQVNESSGGGFMQFSTKDTGGTLNTNMVIDTSGQVGIGTSSPNEELHVSKNGGGTCVIQAENTANSGEAAFNILGKTSGGSVRTFMLKYDAGDNVRIGTPNPIKLGFETSDATRMTISAGGNIGAPTGSNIYNVSDSRLKKNIATLDKGLTSINALRPVSFNWIDGFCDEEKDTLYGFIAQEVKTVDPNLVQQFGADGSVEVNGEIIEDTIRVNEKLVIPMLVKAVQELSAEVTALETKNTKLETDLTALTARVTALEGA